jgi:hypothetical protein
MAFSFSKCHYVLQATLSTCVQRKTQNELAKQRKKLTRSFITLIELEVSKIYFHT